MTCTCNVCRTYDEARPRDNRHDVIGRLIAEQALHKMTRQDLEVLRDECYNRAEDARFEDRD